MRRINSNIDKNYISKIIRNARLKANLTQSELAEKAGIDYKHLSKIETGVYTPSLETFLNLVSLLDLTLEDFGINRETTNCESKVFLQNTIDKASKQQLDAYAELIKIAKHMMKI
jgi:transcriptional regulator with XRE-family HTH domain